jgi:hypothetical protein
LKNSNSTGSLLVLLPLLTLAMFLVTITLLMTTAVGQEEQDGEQQQWLTYESPFGYSIQYPSDWEALEERNYSQNTSSKMFDLPARYFLGALIVSIEPIEKYLDTDTLTLKTRTLLDYAREQRAYVNSEPDPELLRSNSTTIGHNHYPAQQIHFSGGIPELQEEYHINTFMVDRGYLYTFSFFTSPLDIPELLPTVEKNACFFPNN